MCINIAHCAPRWPSVVAGTTACVALQTFACAQIGPDGTTSAISAAFSHTVTVIRRCSTISARTLSSRFARSPREASDTASDFFTVTGEARRMALCTARGSAEVAQTFIA